MPRVQVRIEDLPLYAKHYFIDFGEPFIKRCLHCDAIFDMPSAADERCRKREEYTRLDGDPFRSMGN
jgi:hypothetical protein